MGSSESAQVCISELTHLVVQMCSSTTFTERAALYKFSHVAVWVHLSLMIWGLISVEKSPYNRVVYSKSIQISLDRQRRLVKQRESNRPPQLQTTSRLYDAASLSQAVNITKHCAVHFMATKLWGNPHPSWLVLIIFVSILTAEKTLKNNKLKVTHTLNSI